MSEENKIGRPELLTPELKKKAEQCLKIGLSVQGVCRVIGIRRSTWYLWKVKAERENEALYVDFFEMVEEALGFAEMKLLAEIQKDKSWQSKHTILKRRFQDDWAEKNALEIQIELKEKLKDSPTIDLSLLDPEEEKLFLILTEKALRKSIEIERVKIES